MSSTTLAEIITKVVKDTSDVKKPVVISGRKIDTVQVINVIKIPDLSG